MSREPRETAKRLTLANAQSDNAAWRRTSMVRLEPFVFVYEDLDHTTKRRSYDQRAPKEDGECFLVRLTVATM